jgi:hypothetical protein
MATKRTPSRRLNVALPDSLLNRIAALRRKRGGGQSKLGTELLTIGLKGLGK